MPHSSTLFAVIVLLSAVLAVPGVVDVGHAQEEPVTPPEPEPGAGDGDGVSGPTATPSPFNGSGYAGNSTNNSSTGENGSGFGFGFGGFDVGPSGWEVLTNMANESVESLSAGMNTTIAGVDAFNNATLTVPAPGDRDDPTTWVQPPPRGSWFYGAWWMYWAFSSFVLVAVGAFGVYSASDSSDPKQRHGRIRRTLKAAVGISLGWLLLAFLLHLTNTFTLAVAPSGEEFFATPGSLAKLGVGVALGFLLAIFKTFLVGIALFVVLIQWVLVLFLVATWPLSMGAATAPSKPLQTAGVLGISTFAFLLVLKGTQALFLWFLFLLPLTGDVVADVVVLLVEMVGVFLAFIIFPVVGTKKVVPSAVVSASPSGRGRASIASYAKERGPGGGRIQNRLSSLRGGGDSGGRSRPTRSRSDGEQTSSSSSSTEGRLSPRKYGRVNGENTQRKRRTSGSSTTWTTAKEKTRAHDRKKRRKNKE